MAFLKCTPSSQKQKELTEDMMDKIQVLKLIYLKLQYVTINIFFGYVLIIHN